MDYSYYFGIDWISNTKTKIKCLKFQNSKNTRSCLYLGLSGCAVVKFFKKKIFQILPSGMINKKNYLEHIEQKNLNKTLNDVDFIVLSPGVSFA